MNPFVRQPPQEWDELEARVDLVLDAVESPALDQRGVRPVAPLVAAQLVEPSVLDALSDQLTVPELRQVGEYAATLAAPARDVVELLCPPASRAS